MATSRKEARSCRRGFALLEVILSITLLCIVMLLLFNLYPSSLFALRRGEQQLEASNLATSILNECRAAPFSSLLPGTPIEMGARPGAGGATYSPTLEILPVPEASDRLLELRVTVLWEMRGKEHRLTHSIYRCRLNP